MTNFKDFYDSFLNKKQKEYGDEIYNKSGYYQKKYGFEIGTGKHAMWNNEADAFKHTFMQADLVLKYGDKVAKYFGDRHEKDGNKKMGQPKGEENMDKWNNEQGREIAKEIKQEYGNSELLKKDKNRDDLIAKKVMERMRSGRLITNPNDKRQYKEKGFMTGKAAPVKKSSNSSENENGRWITVNGKHVFIEND